MRDQASSIPWIFALLIVWWHSPGSSARPHYRLDPEYLMDVWETEDGLPENSATAIAQSNDGYLWFGTFNGLVRFDGLCFKVYTGDQFPAFKSAGVVNIHFDRANRIWASTLNGMVALQGNIAQGFGAAEGWVGDYARTFAERENGQLLVTTFDGHILEFKGGRFHALPNPEGHSGLGYLGCVDETGRWWIAQNGFIGYWDGQQWIRVLNRKLAPESVGLGSARGGGIWLLLDRELTKRRDGREVTRITLPERPGDYWSMYEDSQNNVWIATLNNGVTRVGRDGNTKHWTSRNGLSYDSTRSICEDREHNIWIGTSGGGLLRFKRRRFTTYGSEHGLGQRVVRSVATDSSGEMLIATYGGGSVRLNREGSVSGTFLTHGERFAQTILADRQNRVWIGTYGKGLFQSANGQARAVATNYFRHEVAALFEDSKGNIWVGGNDGVMSINNQEQTYYSAAEGLPHEIYRCFAEDSAGRIWTASLQGIFVLTGAKFRELDEIKQIGFHEVNTLKADTNGVVWIGSRTQGLLRWKNGAVSRIGVQEGLSSQVIYGLIEDDRHYFWITSNKGILRVSRRDLENVADGRQQKLDTWAFGISDGLATVECSGNSQPNCAKDGLGQLWFATMKGIARIDPNRLYRNTAPPLVHVETVSYFDRYHKRQQSPYSPEDVAFPAGSLRMRAELSALSFTDPERITFTYRLIKEGRLMSEDTQTDSSIVSEWLPPGKYQLELKASNADGVWTPQALIVPFQVLPFYYETIAFRIFAVLIALGAMGGTTWWIMRSKVRRELQAIEQHKSVAHLQNRLATVLENTTDFVGFANAQGETLYLNLAGRHLLGIPANEDLRSSRIANYHSPGHAERVLNEILPVARSQGVWSGENFLLHRSGAEVPVSQVIIAHRQPDGEVDFYSTIARDITELKRAEASLRESEDRYRTLAEYSPDGISVADPDTVLYANPAIVRMIGAESTTSVIGKSVYTLVPGDLHDAMRMRRAKAMQGEPGPNMEFEFKQPDGSIKVLESRVARITYGNKPALLNIVRDVTASRFAALALEKSEAALRGFINALPEPAILMDANGIALAANSAVAKSLGKPVQEILGRDTFQFIAPHVAAQRRLALTKVLETGQPHHFEDEHKGRFFINYMQPVLESDGSISRVAAFAVNITDRKRTEARQTAQLARTMRQSQALKGLAIHPALLGADCAAAAREITKTACETLEIECCQIWIGEGAGRTWDCVASYLPASNSFESGMRLDTAQCPQYLNSLETSRAIAILDAPNDNRLDEVKSALVGERNVASILIAPVRLAGRLIGHIVAQHMGSVRQWETDEIAFMGGLADQVALSLLSAQREETAAELRELAGRLMSIQDGERRKIGRDLHDSTGQTLAALEINLVMARSAAKDLSEKSQTLLQECIQLANQCSSEIRTTSYLLHPPLLDEMGLVSALRWYADGFTQRSKIAVNLTVPEFSIRLGPEQELALFRVVQEALTNIHRHSASPTATIALGQIQDYTVLQITDFGTGIPDSILRSFREGHPRLGVGLAGMRERIRQLGGELTVESARGETRVTARLPETPNPSNTATHE